MIEIYGARVVSEREWFCTVFPNDTSYSPKDCYTMREAEQYGNEMFGKGNYEIVESW